MSGSLLGGDQQRTKPLFWDWRGASNFENWPRMAVRSGDWKFVSNGDGSQSHLFNIQASRVEEQDSSAFYPELTDSLFLLVSKWRERLPKNIPISKIRFYTNKGGDQVIIDFSATDATLGTVRDPVFRLYRSDKNMEIPIDSISHDARKIYLHLSAQPWCRVISFPLPSEQERSPRVREPPSSFSPPSRGKQGFSRPGSV